MKAFAFVTILVLAAFVLLDGPLPCAATLVSYPDGATSEQVSGFAIRTERLVGKPLRGSVKLRGLSEYGFKFSENVVRIRLVSGETELYAGAPVKSYPAPQGNLAIALQTTPHAGPTFVSIAGACTFGTYWHSFKLLS